MNGLLNLIIEAGHINKEYIDAHTIGFEELKKIVSKWPPERVEEVSGVPADKVARSCADIRHNKIAGVNGTAGRLSINAGNSSSGAGKQYSPDTRHDRKRWLRHLPDEWTTYCTKYPGVRC